MRHLLARHGGTGVLFVDKTPYSLPSCSSTNAEWVM